MTDVAATCPLEPDSPAEHAVCEACLRTGGRWVHLRRCLTCGHVGCCDSSEGRHATRHFHGTGHSIMASAEPGESWCWSYPRKAYCWKDRVVYSELIPG